MPNFAKRFLIVAAALAAAFAVILLCINLYLQSEGVQKRILSAAEQALGAPITLKTTYFTPWGGIVLSGVTVPSPDGRKHNLLEMSSLRLNVALFPLLQGRVVIKVVTLKDPILIVRRQKEGKWVALVPPAPQPEIPIPLDQAPAVEPSTSSAPEGTATTSETTTPAPAARPRAMKVEVKRIRIHGAMAAIMDDMGRTLLRVENANFEADVFPDNTSSGTLLIRELEIGTALRIRKLGGPFTWDGKTISMPEITGLLAGGPITGNYTMHLSGQPTFVLNAEVTDAKLSKLAEDATAEAGKTDGTMKGNIHLSGNPTRADSLTGTANIDLIQARLEPVDFIVKVGELFGIDELQLLKLSEATSQFVIADEQVIVETIRLKSENLILEGQGRADFDGDLKLKSRLLINKKIQKQLGGSLGKNFQPSEDKAYKQLPFNVTGTVSNPKTDLLDRVIGIDLGEDVGGLLKNILRQIPQQDRSKKKKAQPEETPAQPAN